MKSSRPLFESHQTNINELTTSGLAAMDGEDVLAWREEGTGRFSEGDSPVIAGESCEFSDDSAVNAHGGILVVVDEEMRRLGVGVDRDSSP